MRRRSTVDSRSVLVAGYQQLDGSSCFGLFFRRSRLPWADQLSNKPSNRLISRLLMAVNVAGL